MMTCLCRYRVARRKVFFEIPDIMSPTARNSLRMNGSTSTSKPYWKRPNVNVVSNPALVERLAAPRSCYLFEAERFDILR